MAAVTLSRPEKPLLSFQGARRFHRLSPARKREFVEKLSNDEALQLKYLWEAWARDKQLAQIEAPGTHWTNWVHLAGRGNGKTRTGAEWIRQKAESNQVEHMILVARTAADVRDTMVEGESGIMAISPPWFYPKYEPSKRRLTWPNGCTAITFSADEPDALRGPQCLAGHTRVLMANGSQKAIAEIRVGDYVATRKGACRVTGQYLMKRNAQVYLLQTMDRRSIIGTAEHPIWVEGRGFVPLSLLAKGMSLCATHVSNGTDTSGIKTQPGTTIPLSGFTGRYGSKRTGLSQRVAISTIKTAINRITDWKTWNFSPKANTVPGTMRRNSFHIARRPCANHAQHWCDYNKSDWNERLFASIVEKSITVLPSRRAASALNSALRLPGQERSRAIRACVSIAGSTIRQRGERNAIARGNAINGPASNVPQRLQIDRLSARNVLPHSSPGARTPVSALTLVPSLTTISIATVKKLETSYDVYDITVEDAHEFFAEGVLVHNCSHYWADERASWRYEEAWTNLMMGFRLGVRPQGIVTTTPRATKAIKDLKTAPTSKVTVGTTYENRDNLAPAFITEVIKRYEGTRIGRQELLAEILEDVEGALWKRDAMIEAYRVLKHPPLVRVGVAVDPAITSQEGSAETGIIAGGIAENGHAYILDDASLLDSPEEWGKATITCYYRHEADRVYAEINQGGDMVETIVRMLDPNISYQGVRATRGKYTRAEPVAALYERGLVHHVGTFPDLEDQQCSWVQGEKSPDRLDALVWLLTALMLNTNIPLAGDELEPEEIPVPTLEELAVTTDPFAFAESRGLW